jgi:uncharacterized protein YerC
VIAEELSTAGRERLYVRLHRQGRTYRQIAADTRSTAYTVERVVRRAQNDADAQVPGLLRRSAW